MGFMGMNMAMNAGGMNSNQLYQMAQGQGQTNPAQNMNPGGTAPIYTWGELNPSSFFVDPIPQALTLTSIVIGACTTAMSLTLVIKLKESYGTLDTREIRRLNG